MEAWTLGGSTTHATLALSHVAQMSIVHCGNLLIKFCHTLMPASGLLDVIAKIRPKTKREEKIMSARFWDGEGLPLAMVPRYGSFVLSGVTSENRLITDAKACVPQLSRVVRCGLFRWIWGMFQ